MSTMVLVCLTYWNMCVIALTEIGLLAAVHTLLQLYTICPMQGTLPSEIVRTVLVSTIKNHC